MGELADGRVALATTPAQPHPVLDAGGLDVCAPHGAPVVRRLPLAVRFLPTYAGEQQLGRGVFLGSYFGRLQRATQRQAESVDVDVRGWPVCTRCARTRRSWVAATLLLLALGVAGVVTAFVVSATAGPQAWLMAPLLGGFFVVLASVVPLVVGSWPRITGTHGSPDGSAVLVDHAHPAFIAQTQRR
ncbi:MAG: hypothetical protein ABI160_10875 [Mycobacteriaceae bacterium]